MKLDPKHTAFLSLDFQKGILGNYPASEATVTQAAKALDYARKNHFTIIHVGLGFSEGHPEIADFDTLFSAIKKNNLYVRGSASAEFHPAIAKEGELIVYKQRISAFSDNHLEMLLRARGIRELVLFGVATSGIVLSTIRRAFDLDYRCVILKDACYDADPEVHQVLTGKVFPRQAKVLSVEEFLAAQ